MAGVGPGDLQALALELLTACEEALDTIPSSVPGLEGAPERAFVSPGIPSIDCCPQLTVHASQILQADTFPGGLAAGRRFVSGGINHVRLVTTIVRCVVNTQMGASITEVPLAVDLEATAEQVNADAWALWNHIFSLCRSGDLFSLCGEVFFEGMQSMGEAGKCAGWTLSLRVSLDGYNDVEVS